MDIILTCIEGFPEEKIFPLEKTVSVLGRAPECDIVIPDTFVSGRHAVIRQEQPAPVIEDTSKNGTVVNGQRITRIELKDGDEILIHPFRFKVGIYMPESVGDATRIIAAEDASVSIPDNKGIAALSPKTGRPEAPLPEAESSVRSNKNEEIPKARMIMYGVLAAGFIGLLLYGQFGGNDTAEQDSWQAGSARPPVPRTVSQPQHPAVVPAAEKEPDLSEAVKIAESMFNDRTRSQNLYHSIVKLQDVFETARRLHKAVPDEAKYRALLAEARRVLDETHGTLLAEAKILVKQKNYRGAVEVLAKITDLIPNQKDPRHRDALQRIMRYRKYIR